MKVNFHLFGSFIGILLATILCNSLEAQSPLDLKKAQNCLRMIYNAKYDSARSETNSFSGQESVLKNLVEVFSIRWEFIPVIKSSKKEEYLKRLHLILDQLEESSISSASQLYLHATAELLVSEYHYWNGEITQAILHGKKAYPLMMEVFKNDSQEGELLFIRGMYLYYSEFFREKGFVYRVALFPFRDGDKEMGLEVLKKSASIESLAQTEALIYLAHIFLHLEKKPIIALVYSRKLVELYPTNLKFKELLLENLICTGMYKEAEVLIPDLIKVGNAYYKIPALFFKGLIEKEFEKNTDQARKYFLFCVELVKKYGLQENYATKAKEELDKIALN